MRRLVIPVLLFAAAAPAFAGTLSLFTAIPTLDDAGLGLLVAIVAIAGGYAVRRAKKK